MTMGAILENHTLHIINTDKTSEKLTGVMIQVDDTVSVFHVQQINKNPDEILQAVFPDEESGYSYKSLDKITKHYIIKAMIKYANH